MNTINKIRENLSKLDGDTILNHAIRNGLSKPGEIRETVLFINSQYNDNPEMMEEVVGKETISLIKKYLKQ